MRPFPGRRPSAGEADIPLVGPAQRDERVRADLKGLLQARLLHESGLVLFGHPLLIGLVLFLAWGDLPAAVALGWGCAVALATAFRAGWLRSVRRRVRSDRDILQGVRLTVGLLGVTWGVGAAIALQYLPFAETAFLLVVLAGITAGALTTLTADLPSFLGFLGAIAVPLLAGVLASGHDRPHVVTAVVLALYTAVLGVVSRQAHVAMVDHFQVAAQLTLSEEAAKRAEQAMRDARDLAERAARSRSAFLANMSHEIRTPMNAILGFVELILDTELTTEQRRALELVRSSSEALLTILNDVLDYSKIEAEHLEVESIPFDLPKLVHSTASLLAVRAREKHLELLADVSPDVPRLVRGDPTRLRQVLTNLIGNAIKFTDQGEVVVSAACGRVENARVEVRLSVRDTGIGIAPEQLTTVFEEFTQADASMTRRYGGTGLGLAISRRLVGLMSGELRVTSEVGRGSEFHFTLSMPVEAVTGPLATARATLGGRRALVVDDNQTNRRILRDMLAAEGIAVDEATGATGGIEALRGLAERGAPYDVAILDVQMPDRDGFELAAEVRADPRLAMTRLVMLTSAGQRGDGDRCRELGIEAYLTKPTARADLIEALGAVLAVPQGGAPAVITRHTIAESRPSLRILLADDNQVNQQVAAAMLLKRGHLVDVVSDGRQAVAAVQRREYDVVLMDVQMPEMDGFEATRAIRALPKAAHLPIIALTAHALSGERERCLAHGMTAYLAKPFKGHELLALIEGRRDRPPVTPVVEGSSPVDLDAFRTTLREAGAEEAVDSILQTFLEQAPGRLGAVVAAIAGGQNDEITRAAHAFRGAAATIGAHELAGLLQIMELAARDGDLQRAREEVTHVQEAAAAVIEHLQRGSDHGTVTVAPPP